MPQLINWELARHPINWVIVFGTVTIVVMLLSMLNVWRTDPTLEGA